MPSQYEVALRCKCNDFYSENVSLVNSIKVNIIQKKNQNSKIKIINPFYGMTLGKVISSNLKVMLSTNLYVF